MLLLVAFVPSKMPAAMRLSVLNVSLTQSINLQAVSALTCKNFASNHTCHFVDSDRHASSFWTGCGDGRPNRLVGHVEDLGEPEVVGLQDHELAQEGHHGADGAGLTD